jgi:phenylalanyl-tRNA synthetase beta chain
LEIVGGTPGPVVDVVSAEHLPRNRAVPLRRERVRRVLGLEIADAIIVDILQRLEMEVEETAEGWRVTAPSCRFDIAIEVDLIEDIGRIYGYSEIPMSHAVVNTAMQPQPEARFDLDRAKELLVDRDFQEVVTYSFVSPEMQALVDPELRPVALANPLSAELSVMRTSLWTGLLLSAQFNQARQQERIRLFESGLSFVQAEAGLIQEPMLAGLIMGGAAPEQWDGAARPVDFYDAKGDLETLLEQVAGAGAVVCVPGDHSALHPGQCARLERNGEPVGWLGMLHPQLQGKLDLAGNVYLFDLRLQGVAEGALPAFRPLSKFPSIRRDLALVMDEGLSYQQVRDTVRIAAQEILKDIFPFDVYTGTKIDSGRKSLALGLILQDSSHTLTDVEVDAAVSAILQRLETDLGATLRE